MPSASAKLEKQTSTETGDTPVKQLMTVVEKKVRNLEKKKVRLDNLRAEHENGKDLDKDQQLSLQRYDHVLEVLEFAKELQKNFNSVLQENAKLQKRLAKREQAERYQQEVQRIRELLLLQDILNNLGTEEVRSDFMTGTNGALQLSEESINQLDELFKLICPERNLDQPDGPPFDEQLNAAAEHFMGLLEGKNKDVLGSTYKNLKDMVLKIGGCGYFDRNAPVAEPAEEISPDIGDAPPEGRNAVVNDDYAEEEEEYDVPCGVTEIVPSAQDEQGSVLSCATQQNQVEKIPSSSSMVSQAENYFSAGNAPVNMQTFTVAPARVLPEVLSMQGNFNFLQESQIDLESPHMDPAVVAAHPMAPPPTMGYHQSQYSQQHQSATQSSQQSSDEVRVALAQSTDTTQSLAGGAPADFDPSEPIPTQTFTNQNFASAVNMMSVSASSTATPPNFIPVSLPAQHMLPVGMVPPAVVSIASDASVTLGAGDAVPSHPISMASQAASVPMDNMNMLEDDSNGKDHWGDINSSEFQSSLDNEDTECQGETSHYHSSNDGFSNTSQQCSQYGQSGRGSFNNRGMRGARGRGTMNGYSRGGGRAGYGNSRVSITGGYQGSGYQQGSYNSRDNYNSNYRRGSGSPRGGSRGMGPRGGNSSRGGRGGYRSQQQQ